MLAKQFEHPVLGSVIGGFRARHLVCRLALVFVASGLAYPASAQSAGAFGTCVPRAERKAGAIGCFIIADHAVGKLGAKPVYWHILRFPTREAATKARSRRGTVIEAFDHFWVMDIASLQSRTLSGNEVANIGPLPIDADTPYSALYMEASMRPGMKSKVHRHSGPEVWYTLSGETCLETPSGASVGRAGGAPVIIPGSLPMELTATGKELRRSLVLILHDARKPPTTMETHWIPGGKCK